MQPDRLAGMILYGALGDALGAPWELRYKPKADSSFQGTVDGTLIHPVRVGKYYHKAGEMPYNEYPAGTVTDDTTMTQTLLCWLESCHWKPSYHYQADGMVVCDVILAYMHWAKTCPFLGNNTRQLLKVDNPSMALYARRWEKHAHAGASLGNGCLMRAPPLALLRDDGFAMADCSITNNNDVSRACVSVYLGLLRQALTSTQPLTPWLLQQQSAQPLIQSAYQTATQHAAVPAEYTLSAKHIPQNRHLSPLGPWKGSVMAGIWCAAYAAFRLDQLTSGTDTRYHMPLDQAVHMILHEIISFKGDTDSDCKIAGAVIGARMGWQYLAQQQSYNVAVLFQQQPWLRSCADHQLWHGVLAQL